MTKFAEQRLRELINKHSDLEIAVFCKDDVFTGDVWSSGEVTNAFIDTIANSPFDDSTIYVDRDSDLSRLEFEIQYRSRNDVDVEFNNICNAWKNLNWRKAIVVEVAV